jgi:hypothetical protein
MDNFFLKSDFLQPIKATHKKQYSIYRYKQVVEDYSKRQLSFDHDALNAFAGALDFFEAEAGFSCFWGIPIPDFESALCWFGTGNIIPRAEGDFPSWSWVAWHNPVEFIVLDQGFHLIHAHKAQSSNDSRNIISIGSDQVPHHPIYHGSPAPLQQRRCPTASEIRSTVLPLIRDNFHITFWTSATSLKIGHANSIDYYLYTEIYPHSSIILESDKFTLDTAKAWPSKSLSKGAIGFCFGSVHDSVLRTENTRPLEFVLLSKCSQQKHPYPSLRKPVLVMLVSWDIDTEIAKREALALVEEVEWFAADPREKLVVLG